MAVAAHWSPHLSFIIGAVNKRIGNKPVKPDWN